MNNTNRVWGNFNIQFFAIGFMISLRFICDGVLKFDFFGQEITKIIAAIFAVIAVICLMLRFSNWITPVICLIILLTSSILGSSSWGNSGLEEFVRTLALVGIYAFATEFLNYTQIMLLVRLFCILMSANSMFVLWQVLQGTGIRVDGVERYSGFLAHPNSSALLAGSSLLLLQVLKEKIQLSYLIWFKILLSFSLILSLSFMGLLTFGVMSALAFILASPSIKSIFKIGLYGIFGALGLFVFNSGFRERFFQFTTSNKFVTGSETNSLQWRFDKWSRLLDLWEAKPLFGQGYGTSTSGLMLNGMVPHNEYLRLLLEVGIFGFTIVVIMYLLRLKYFYRQVQSRRSPEAIAISCLLVGGAFNAFTENTFQYTLWEILLLLIMSLAEKEIRPRTFKN